jgi:hypothetical protein
MSTSVPPPSAPAAPYSSLPREIRIYGHSSLFYWWPVWALGFLLFLISWFDNTRIIHVPSGTKVAATNPDNGEYQLSNPERKDALKKRVYPYLPDTPTDDQRTPPRVSHRHWMGATYCIVLLLVILITTVPLRGLWSVVVIVMIVLLSVIFALAGWWDDIFEALGGLHIYIGLAGYLFVSTVLFIMWVISVFVFDRQTYFIFEPGQMRVCEEVGAGEKSYDTVGMSIEKHRDDLFRHWVLGLGSGDLTVRTSGQNAQEFRMNNVLFIGTKLDQIQDLQRTKQMV